MARLAVGSTLLRKRASGVPLALTALSRSALTALPRSALTALARATLTALARAALTALPRSGLTVRPSIGFAVSLAEELPDRRIAVRREPMDAVARFHNVGLGRNIVFRASNSKESLGRQTPAARRISPPTR